MDEHVATIWFIDGVWRPVYEGADGRQYVIDGSGEKVYGVWYIPPDDATPTFIVNAAAQH
jgi:PBCV-specific basic adaptor domain